MNVRKHFPHEGGVVHRMLHDEKGGVDGIGSDLGFGRPAPARHIVLEPGAIGRIGLRHLHDLGMIDVATDPDVLADRLIGAAALLELAPSVLEDLGGGLGTPRTGRNQQADEHPGPTHHQRFFPDRSL